MLAFFTGIFCVLGIHSSFQHSPIKYSDSQKSSYSHSYNLLMRLPPHIIHTRISVLFQGPYFTFSSDAKGHYLFGLKEEWHFFRSFAKVVHPTNKKMTEVHLEKQNQTILPPFALKLLSFKPNFSVPFFFPFLQYSIILATLALSDS